MTTPIEGFEVTIHHAITQPMLWAGAPRLWTIVNGTVGGILVFAWHQWLIGGLLWIGLQSLGVLLAKYDPYFPEIVIRHLRYKAFYHV